MNGPLGFDVVCPSNFHVWLNLPDFMRAWAPWLPEACPTCKAVV